MSKPLEDLLVDAVLVEPKSRVLDVGCGTGSTTLAVARMIGAKGCCVGIDISDPMLAAARTRAERERTPASFRRADVQIHDFEPVSFARWNRPSRSTARPGDELDHGAHGVA